MLFRCRACAAEKKVPDGRPLTEHLPSLRMTWPFFALYCIHVCMYVFYMRVQTIRVYYKNRSMRFVRSPFFFRSFFIHFFILSTVELYCAPGFILETHLRTLFLQMLLQSVFSFSFFAL